MALSAVLRAAPANWEPLNLLKGAHAVWKIDAVRPRLTRSLMEFCKAAAISSLQVLVHLS